MNIKHVKNHYFITNICHCAISRPPPHTPYPIPFHGYGCQAPQKRKPEKSFYYQTFVEFISLLDVSSIFCICIYYTLILASAGSGFGRSCSVARGR